MKPRFALFFFLLFVVPGIAELGVNNLKKAHLFFSRVPVMPEALVCFIENHSILRSIQLLVKTLDRSL